MKVNIQKFNEDINVDNGLISVSDPSYDNGTWCAIYDVKVKPGYYTGFAHTGKLGDWGKRVITLQAIHKDYLNDSIMMVNFEDDGWEEIGCAAVDAGLMSIFKAGTKKDYDDNEWSKFCDEIEKGEFWNIDNMLVSSSGIGDGNYPVYVYKVNNEVVSIAVDFLDHPWLGK